MVQVRLLDSIENTDQEFQDIGQRLKQIENDLPDGAGPITWISDFGDTAALDADRRQPARARDGDRSGRARRARGDREGARRRHDAARGHPALLSRVGLPRHGRAAVQAVRRRGAAGRHRTRRPAAVGGQLLGGRLRDQPKRRGGPGLWPAVHGSADPDSPTSTPTPWGPILIRDPQTTTGPARGAGQQSLFVPAARRLHRPDPADAAARPAGREGAARGRPARADLPRLLARAARLLRLPGGEDQGGPERPQRDRSRGRPRDPDQERPHRRHRRVPEHAGDRGRAGRHVIDRRARVPAGPGVHLARIREPHAVPELPHLPRRVGDVAAQPRDHPGRADALGRADRRLRQGRGRGHRRRAAPAPARPHRRAHLGPAAAGGRAGEPADGKPVGGDRARRDRRPGRLLGLARGHAHGGLDPADAGHGLRDLPGHGHRHPAGLDRDADHRARAARGHAGGGGRRHQARAGPRIATRPRVVDRPEQARQGHHLRHHHQHRRLPAVPAADRRHRTSSSTACPS